MNNPLIAEFIDLYAPEKGVWGSHPNYPVEDWRDEVRQDDTRLGYWEWCYEKSIQDSGR